MNTIHRILITTTLMIVAGTAGAAGMDDAKDMTKPDLRTGSAVDGARGARTEDVIDRPTVVRTSADRRFERSSTRSSRTERQPQRKAPPKRTNR